MSRSVGPFKEAARRMCRERLQKEGVRDGKRSERRKHSCHACLKHTGNRQGQVSSQVIFRET